MFKLCFSCLLNVINLILCIFRDDRGMHNRIISCIIQEKYLKVNFIQEVEWTHDTIM
jgi:hypothetical protein